MDMHYSIALKRYSSEWKLYRRLFTQHIHPTSITKSFSSQLVKSTHRLLKLLLHDSDNLREYLFHYSASITLGVAYGYEPQPTKDALIAMAEKVGHMSGEGIQLKFLPNILPAGELSYLFV
jgi:hypothetical protein